MCRVQRPSVGGNTRTTHRPKRKTLKQRTYLFVGTFSGPFVQVDVGLLQYDVGETPADTLDGGHGEHDFALAIDVGTEDTQNVLELFWDDQRLKKKPGQR